MRSVDTSDKQVIGEAELLRRRVAELEELGAERKRAEEKLKESGQECRSGSPSWAGTLAKNYGPTLVITRESRRYDFRVAPTE